MGFCVRDKSLPTNGTASAVDCFTDPARCSNFVRRKQATLPALASILPNKQVQFLPVQWRATLKLGDDEMKDRERDGLDNTFSISGAFGAGHGVPGMSHYLGSDRYYFEEEYSV